MNLGPSAIMAALLLVCPAARAGGAEDLAAAIGKCAAIADNMSRWACYDRLPALVKKVAPAASQTAATQSAAPPSKKDEESWFGIGDWFGHGQNPNGPTTPQQFGSEGLPPPSAAPGVPPPPEPLDRITASVSSVTINGVGIFTVVLDNGQVWRQTEGGDQARFSKDRKNQITITRGMLGSYSLKIGDLPHIYRVKRIK
jgi:hypothetical protein